MKAEVSNGTDKVPPQKDVYNLSRSFSSNFLKDGPNQGKRDTSHIPAENSSVRILQEIKETAYRSTLISESFENTRTHVRRIDNLGLQGANGAPLPKLKPEWEALHKVKSYHFLSSNSHS
jgi:hypothetical protein